MVEGRNGDRLKCRIRKEGDTENEEPVIIAVIAVKKHNLSVSAAPVDFRYAHNVSRKTNGEFPMVRPGSAPTANGL